MAQYLACPLEPASPSKCSGDQRSVANNEIHETSDLEVLDILEFGTCGVVHIIDAERVIKIFPLSSNPADTDSTRFLAIEARVYERLGPHARICGYFGRMYHGLVLERLEKSLARHFYSLPERRTDTCLAWRWSIQVAEAVVYLHSKNILHADLGCHNVLLTSSNHVKLCDFAGSSIDGEEPMIYYKTRHHMYTDDDDVTIQTEIFALGYTLYEIWTTREPYADLEEEIVRGNFRRGKFPDVGNLPTASVILKCWNGEFRTAQAVLEELKNFHELSELSKFPV